MDELAERIGARLNEALDRQAAAGIISDDDRGMVADLNGWVLLSVADVARIAAAEAHDHFRVGSAEQPTSGNDHP